MTRLSKAFATVTAACLAVPVWAGPASAETATEAASSAAYFYRAGVSKPDASPAAPPNLTAQADGVAAGNLAVAAQAGAEDKVSFLYFSLSDLPVGATITKAVVTVPLVPSGNGNVVVNAAPERVTACKIIGSGFSTEDGESLALAPERDCAAFKVPGVAGPEGTSYSFDVTPLAATWLEVNDGLALTRNPEGEANFQVVFSREATLDYEFTAPPTDDTATGGMTSDATTTFDSGSFDTGAGTGSFDSGTGSFDSGSGTSDFGSSFGSAETPVLPADEPIAAGPDVATEEPTVALPATERVGSVDVPLTPPIAFWVVGVLLAGLLAALSLIMGDARLPVASTSRQSRLSQALAARSRAGAVVRPLS